MNNLIERLRKIEALKPGDMVPSEMLDENGSWATLMSKLCGEAADEIERLQSMAGAVSKGPSFSDLRLLPRSCSTGPVVKKDDVVFKAIGDG